MPWSWGLDRIDADPDEIGNKLIYDSKYHYDYTGKDIMVAVLDTGIKKTHMEFQTSGSGGDDEGKRIHCGFNAFMNDIGETCDDIIGHGTFISGIIGGMISGVAKNVNLLNVKIVRSNDNFLCVGSILSGLDYVLAMKLYEPTTNIIINLSVSGPKRDSINESIKVLYQHNIFVVTSAGNNNEDACTKSPASSEYAITVGSTNYNDEISSYSNYGYCLDIYAPGNEITSSWIRSNTDIITLNGTSLSAAYVTGVIALILEAYPTSKISDVEETLKLNAYKNILLNIKNGSPNLLLNIIDKNIQK